MVPLTSLVLLTLPSHSQKDFQTSTECFWLCESIFSHQLCDEVSLLSLMIIILGSGTRILCRQEKLQVKDFVAVLVYQSFYLRACLATEDSWCRFHVPHH